MLVRPVIDFRHSPENGSAKSRMKSIRPGSIASMMRSAWAWNSAVQCAFTVLGDTVGNIARRST